MNLFNKAGFRGKFTLSRHSAGDAIHPLVPTWQVTAKAGDGWQQVTAKAFRQALRCINLFQCVVIKQTATRISQLSHGDHVMTARIVSIVSDLRAITVSYTHLTLPTNREV